METLKLKIYDVLKEEITISEFENWLYNSEYMKTEIKADSLLFDVININYRLENSLKILKNLSLKNFSEEELLIFKLEYNCYKIVNSEDTKNYKKYVLNIIQDFEFDNDFEGFGEFYYIYYSFDGYDYNQYQNISSNNLNSKTKHLANSLLKSLKNCNSIEEKIKTLKLKKEPENDEENINVLEFKSLQSNKKLTLVQKLFAFLKKI
ncbi:hypothetical protein [Winogradskyella pacifica]|uniref:Uncharacterized protein n=1 Tax=Winogradskyella pacifica TaxID=664642 RepID=A0A3D9N9G3_9FLAO|nr:hypothetical protein [Winogradskyella pacifica]REE27930.1 hypothetical protein DFQ09_101771 [Winogradskyella pacifica]